MQVVPICKPNSMPVVVSFMRRCAMVVIWFVKPIPGAGKYYTYNRLRQSWAFDTSA